MQELSLHNLKTGQNVRDVLLSAQPVGFLSQEVFAASITLGAESFKSCWFQELPKIYKFTKSHEPPSSPRWLKLFNLEEISI